MGLRTKERFVDPVVNLWTGENRKRLRGRANQRNRCWLRLSIAALLVALVSCSAFFIHSYRAYAKIVDARLAHGYLISRAGIYAAPRTLRPGQKFSNVSLAAVLRRAGYIESEDGGEIWNGSFTLRDNTIALRPNTASAFPARCCETPATSVWARAARPLPSNLSKTLTSRLRERYAASTRKPCWH